MRRITGLVLGLMMFAGAGSALAQVDCSGGDCVGTKYGLGNQPNYRKDENPVNNFRYTNAFFGPDFGGLSFFASRSDLTGAPGNCGPERQHSPLPGQVHTRERTTCTPTSFGPACSAGNVDAACHLPSLNEGCTGAGAPLACCSGAGQGTCLGNELCTGNGVPQACCTGSGTGSCPPAPTSAANTVECGTGGVCTMGAGLGCRVEIPLTDGGVTPVGAASEVSIFTFSAATASNGDTFSLSAQTGNTIGGTSSDRTCEGGPNQNAACTVDADCPGGACQDCPAPNVRKRPTTGTRYLLPTNRGGDGTTMTYVRWDSGKGIPSASLKDFTTSFRIHTDDSAVCCNAGNPSLNTCNAVNPGTPNYPLIASRSCRVVIPSRYVDEDNVTADWIFEAGRGSRFHTDNDFVLPGEMAGLCTINSSTSCFAPGANALCTGNRSPYACCTAASTGTCTQDCTGLDIDPVTPGIQLGDTCSFRQPGHRVQTTPPCGRDGNGDSNKTCCGTALYHLRGTPDVGCSTLPRFAYNGDPGSDCGVGNYGIDHRDDENCDGVADYADLCPFSSEWDQDLDSDPDCDSGPGGDCRGDECECGDQGGSGVLSGAVELGNGVVDVSDIVAINNAIFGSVVKRRICDANGDTLCNVSDIVGANREIFVPDSSICRHMMPRQCLAGVPNPCCGNGLVDAATTGSSGGEVCDDGDLDAGDGCNAACRVEFGFTCTAASPSVCTPL